jgi:hypothetical protein
MGELKLTEKEQKLTQEIVSRLRQTPYGEMTFTVHLKNRQPIRLEVDKAKESVML